MNNSVFCNSPFLKSSKCSSPLQLIALLSFPIEFVLNRLQSLSFCSRISYPLIVLQGFPFIFPQSLAQPGEKPHTLYLFFQPMPADTSSVSTDGKWPPSFQLLLTKIISRRNLSAVISDLFYLLTLVIWQLFQLPNAIIQKLQGCLLCKQEFPLGLCEFYNKLDLPNGSCRQVLPLAFFCLKSLRCKAQTSHRACFLFSLINQSLDFIFSPTKLLQRTSFFFRLMNQFIFLHLESFCKLFETICIIFSDSLSDILFCFTWLFSFMFYISVSLTFRNKI